MSHAWSHASPCSFSMHFSIFSRKRGFSLKGGGDSDIHYPMCHLLFFRYWQHCSFTSKSRGFSKISLAIHFAKSRAGSFPRSSIHFCLSFFLMLEYEPRVFCMLGKYCTTHLYPQPLSITLERQLKYYLISKTFEIFAYGFLFQVPQYFIAQLSYSYLQYWTFLSDLYHVFVYILFENISLYFFCFF